MGIVMLVKSKKVECIILFSIAVFFFFSLDAVCQQPKSLNDGINLYRAGKYSEAINDLLKARQDDPKSSITAFYLGMAYKHLEDYETAEGHLRDAVTMTPKIKEALIELIDILVRLKKTDEANKWIAVAEKENFQPANTAFLKGLALTQEGKNSEAIESFEKAKSLDPKIAQASEIQIAFIRMRDSKLESAKESFQSAITADPQTDLAGFARQYLARVEEVIKTKKPVHFTLSLFGQYDDNMVLKPTDESLATAVTNEESFVANTAFKTTYSPTINGPWLFNAFYAISSSLHKNHGKTHDSLINTISMTPGYNFGRYALNLSATYSYAMVRNPSYKKYSGYLIAGPMMRLALNGSQLLEVFAGYADNNYFEPALINEENRDSSGLSAYGSWVWLLKKNTFLNLRYQFFDQNSAGSNWDNFSNSLSANVVIPTIDGVKLQLNGEYTKKNFKNIHTVFDLKRADSIYNLSAGITWAFNKKASLIGQYTWINNGSNIAVYDYTRNLYTLGMEYRF
jgi:tetratricopeptide (TPR) repeat protein